MVEVEVIKALVAIITRCECELHPRECGGVISRGMRIGRELCAKVVGQCGERVLGHRSGVDQSGCNEVLVIKENWGELCGGG